MIPIGKTLVGYGYMHIDNAYKFPDIMMFKEVYALEKIHGSSAHIRMRKEYNEIGQYTKTEVQYFAGGESHERFVSLFDEPKLIELFHALGHNEITVNGEVYGGKCQGMKHVYGPSLKFVAFDVRVGETWLSVPNADDVAKKLGLEFVFYELIPATVDAMNAARDRPSEQAIRNGWPFEPNTGRVSEGVVLRPVIELTRSDGKRIMCKHKADSFRETAMPRQLSEAELKVLSEAKAVADEWVTPMRLEHVLQRVQAPDISHTGTVCKAMVEDVKREAGGEVVWSQQVEQAVKKATGSMFKKKILAL